MSYNLDTVVVSSTKEEENGEKAITVALDSRHTAVLSRKAEAGKTSIAVLDSKYNAYCTREVFPEYNRDVISVSDDEAKRLVKDMLALFKR